MILRVSEYDPEFDAIWITTNAPHDVTDEIHYRFGHVLDYDSATYMPTALELLMCVGVYIPLSPEHGYDPETDTLTFGDANPKAELVVANGDLVAHWAYDEANTEPEFYVPIAVELRNASKHLAPVISRIEDK